VKSHKLEVIASQVVRLIGCWSLPAEQIVCTFQSEMAEFVLQLRKKIKYSLTRQGTKTIRCLHKKELAERNEYFHSKKV